MGHFPYPYHPGRPTGVGIDSPSSEIVRGAYAQTAASYSVAVHYIAGWDIDLPWAYSGL
jgi:hypothetical protein